MRYTTPLTKVPTSNPKLLAWVDEVIDLCDPGKVWWCDGTTEEYDELAQTMTETGTARWLDPDLRPNSLYVRSDPADVARVEDRTFICSKKHEDAGPTNNWGDPP